MHSFDPTIAQQVGINAAIIYQNIFWWCQKNAANERNIIDGRAWSYNSVRAFTTLFPYLSAKQVRTALECLVAHGLIMVANHNADPRDRTKWYAACDPNIASQMADGLAPQGKDVGPTGQNTLAPEGEPLPVIKPVINTVGKQEHAHRVALSARKPDFEASAGEDDGPRQGKLILDDHVVPDKSPKQKIAGGLHDTCQTLDEEFERVWAKYPRKVGKGAARKAWAKARAKTGFMTIAAPLALWIKLQRGADPKFIPHFSTWLIEERWGDNQAHARNRAETTADRLDRLDSFCAHDHHDACAGARRPFPEIELRI